MCCAVPNTRLVFDSVCVCVCVCVCAVPNTHLVLWLQQFAAMFLKRFYNSLRFYGALVSQLILPLLFVIFGLAVAVSVPSNQIDDQPRELRIDNSGLSPGVAKVFFAQFGDPAGPLNFSVS